MLGDSCWRRKLRTSSRNASSSSLNSRRMAAAGNHDGRLLVFCSTELSSEFVQNYEYACRSLSMKTPHKQPAAKRPKTPLRASSVKADRHFVTALARGLEVLACFRHGDRVLGNQELSQRCGLAKSTISRLTHTLTKLGYLIYVEDSAKYSLGTATLSLGSAMLSRL